MAAEAGVTGSGGSGSWRVGDVVDGRYEVLRVHDQGAMGLVYRVRHLRWGTDLAMKCPRPGLLASVADRERFVVEAETWVSLVRHPNVCGCHHVRVLGGIPYVFAEYVPGGSLREWIDDGRLYEGDEPTVLARILDFAIQTARGLEHAHREGIVHRDIKPANVLLGPDGIAKVTDFGLAAASTTTPSAGGMTPAYASPEQAGGSPVGWAVGRRGDVYSLAVSVLEMFTGGVTWMAGPVAGAALDAYLEEAGSGGDGLPRMPRALAALLARCLDRNALRRPGSMTELAAELTGIHRKLTGADYQRPVPDSAELRADDLNNRGVSFLELDREKEAERAFAAALTADPQHQQAVYNAGLLAWRRGAPDKGVYVYDAPRPVTDVELLTRLDAARERSGDDWPIRLMLAEVHLERGDTEAAGSLSDALVREHSDEPEVRALAETLRSGRVPTGRCAGTREVSWHTGRWDPLDPPTRLTIDGRWALTGDSAGTTHLWDLRHGRHRLTLTDTTPEAVAITSDGRAVVSAHGDGRLRCHETAAGDCLYEHALPGWRAGGEVGFVRLDAHDQEFVVAVAGEVQRWRTGEPEPRDRLKLGFRKTRWPEADRRWITASDDGRWALALPRVRERRAAHSWWDVTPYVDSEYVELWNLDSGRRRLVLQGGGDGVVAVSLSADGGYALVAGHRLLHLWDLGSGRCLSRFVTGSGEPTALSLSADARLALSAGADGAVRLWDVHQGRCLRTFTGHRQRVAAVLIGPSGDTGLSLAHDNTARWWLCGSPGSYTAPPQPSRPWHREPDARAQAPVTAAGQAPADGRRHRDGPPVQDRHPPGDERGRWVPPAVQPPVTREVFAGLRTARPVRTFRIGYAGAVDTVAIDSGGRKVFCLGDGGLTKTIVRTWDVATGQCRLTRHRDSFSALAISDTGTRVMAYGSDGLVVWSADFVELTRVRNVRTGPSAEPAAFSPDGRRAVLVNADHMLQLYNLGTGRCLRHLARNETRLTAVALSRDGRRAVSADSGGQVRLWDVDGGRCLRLLDEHPGVPASLSLSADGGRVLSCGRHNAGMVLWDATTGARLRVFGDRSERSERSDASERSDGSRVGRLTGDGRFAVSGGVDGSVRVWDADSGACVHVFNGHEGEVRALALTPDGRYVLSGGADGTLRLWELDWELAVADGGLR
ncbi:WD40 repeat domain-containing serine/threonine protein kinase [Streptomyces sp. NPDC004752]